MKKLLFTAGYCFLVASCFAQNISQRIENAYRKFDADSQLRHAISSLYVINVKTGKVVFDKNSQVGLAPASTQKIITAAAAFELLGRQYRYRTEFGYKGIIDSNKLKGFLYLTGSGDPTLGTWRYPTTSPAVIYNNLMSAIAKAGIKNDSSYNTFLLLDLSRYSDEVFNDAWIWQDIGNYYGIGSCALNWRENQFDAVITPGRVGEKVKSIKLVPNYVKRRLNVNNQLTTGEPKSGDNSYFYLSVGIKSNEYELNLKGSIPAGVDSFVVSACHPDPPLYFSEFLLSHPVGKNITQSPNYPLFGRTAYYWGGDSSYIEGFNSKGTILYTHYSPSLDSIIYWFLQKSINLFGEALVKTISYEKNGFGETGRGISILKDFWRQNAIDESELNISDGSGLSPQDRVTAHAQVEVLKYAKTKDWFPYFYAALPTYNGMKMKSGSIRDVKGFCGYQKSADGNEYIFSFLVNNYNGSSSTVVNKMYKVLDVLK